jgi:hypothetical protein
MQALPSFFEKCVHVVVRTHKSVCTRLKWASCRPACRKPAAARNSSGGVSRDADKLVVRRKNAASSASTPQARHRCQPRSVGRLSASRQCASLAALAATCPTRSASWWRREPPRKLAQTSTPVHSNAHILNPVRTPAAFSKAPQSRPNDSAGCTGSQEAILWARAGRRRHGRRSGSHRQEMDASDGVGQVGIPKIRQGLQRGHAVCPQLVGIGDAQRAPLAQGNRAIQQGVDFLSRPGSRGGPVKGF